jgi:hypothetical protein
MKNFIAILLPLVLLMACNSVEKHRESINTLAADWDTTTASVMEFAGTLQGEQAAFQQNLSSMVVSEDAMGKMKEDKKMMLMDAFTGLQSSGSAYAGISNELNTFVAEWQEKSNEVNALKEGLESGKLAPEAVASISDLSAYVAEAQTQLGTWKEQLEAANATVAAQKSAYEAVVAEVMPSM